MAAGAAVGSGAGGAVGGSGAGGAVGGSGAGGAAGDSGAVGCAGGSKFGPGGEEVSSASNLFSLVPSSAAAFLCAFYTTTNSESTKASSISRSIPSPSAIKTGPPCVLLLTFNSSVSIAAFGA